jgi:hypothetical protein
MPGLRLNEIGKNAILSSVIPAQAGIQIVPLCEASNFSAFSASYNLGSSFRWNDGYATQCGVNFN